LHQATNLQKIASGKIIKKIASGMISYRAAGMISYRAAGMIPLTCRRHDSPIVPQA